MLPGGLPEQKVRADRAVVMRPAVQRTSGGHLIANLSLACHKGDAGRVDLPGPDATVAFPDADIQVAADILAQVGKLKRPRRHPGLVQNATILADGDLCITVRNAANFRGIPLKRGRQHALIAGQSEPGKAEGVKNSGAEVRLSERQF